MVIAKKSITILITWIVFFVANSFQIGFAGAREEHHEHSKDQANKQMEKLGHKNKGKKSMGSTINKKIKSEKHGEGKKNKSKDKENHDVEETNPEDLIAICMADSSGKLAHELELMLQVLTRQVASPAFLFPVAEGFGEFIFSALGNPKLQPPCDPRIFDASNPAMTCVPQKYENYQWFANKLPPKYNNASHSTSYPGLPPNYSPESVDFTGATVPFPDYMFPGFYHNETDIRSWGFQKWPSFALCFPTLGGRKVAQFRRNDPDILSLFTMNLDVRGANNERKRQYMSALTCEKLPKYEAAIDHALDRLVHAIEFDHKPVLSTWYDIVSDLFWDLHLGDNVNRPNFLRRYIKRLFNATANIRGVCDPVSPAYDEIISAYCEAQEVTKYIIERDQVIQAEADDTTFIYWWNKAGIPVSAILLEVVHNSLAFIQWINVVFLAIAAQLGGYTALDFQGGLVGKQIDFFQKYSEATSEQERLNVAREFVRLTMPDNIWLSTLEQTANHPSDNFTDPSFDHTVSGHVPLFIQAMNDIDPITGASIAANYDTSRYIDFEQRSGKVCPFAHLHGGKHEILTPEDFQVSAIDGETMIPAGHEKLIPIFDTPKYCPFGLGYRRCPAEGLNYMFVGKVLQKLGHMKFKEVGISLTTDPAYVVGGLPSNSSAFATGVSVGPFRRIDNIYVDNKSA
ncbi:hypothetical protein ACA910_018530 [Epithemia clementina (nom. ined.)]